MFHFYIEAVSHAIRVNPTWRIGQAYFNVLDDMEPEIARRVQGSPLDPFYNDSRITAFLEQVAVWMA
jgi:hypothetical protein